MTGATLQAAVAGLGQIAIGTNAGLAVQAPEQSIVADNAGIRFSRSELTLPSQCRAEVGMMDVETIRLPDHAAPPDADAAFKIARFTATRASCTLYEFWLSGFAPLKAAEAACCAVSSVTGCPARICSASADGQGTGATYPITTRAD